MRSRTLSWATHNPPNTEEMCMANTYTQIYIQAVFAVEGRQSLIVPEHKIEIYKYMTTVIFRIRNTRSWRSMVCPIMFTC